MTLTKWLHMRRVASPKMQRTLSTMNQAQDTEQCGARETSVAEPSAKQGRIARLKALFVEYGTIGMMTWLGIFALTWAGFATVLALGFELESSSSSAGIAGAAYVATQLTKPLRIGATIVLTPAVAKVWYRFRPPSSRETS